MTRKTFHSDSHGQRDPEDQEFIDRLSDLAETYGYAVTEMTVRERPAKRDDSRWHDDGSSEMEDD